MIKQAPHLPQKSSSIPMHNLWINIRFTIYVGVIGLLAGITGALVSMAWLEPEVVGSNQNILFVNKVTEENDLTTWSKTPSLLAAKRLEYSTINIFDKSLSVVNNFYPQNAFLGRVAMLTSNGWGVFYYPEFNKNNLNNWLALDSQGIEYKIENTIFDNERGFVYVKFVGNNFRVMSFPNWNNFTHGSKVWVSNYNVWKERQLGDTIVVTTDPHLVTEQYSRLRLEPETESGNIVMTEEGHFVGFVDKEGLLQTAWYAEFQLPNLLEKGDFIKSKVDFEGYFVERHGISSIDATPGKGFFVTNLGKNNTNLKKNDIIVSVNNLPLDSHNLWKTILMSEKDLSLVVWRNGQEITIKN